MAEGKKSIVVYSDWINKFEVLTDEEAGRLIKHFFRYVNDLNPAFPDRITELSFIDIQQQLKRDLVKWEQRAERSRENGRNGGRPKNPEKPKETQQVILKPRKPDTVNVNVNDTVNDININSVGLPTSTPTKGTLNDMDKCQLFVDAFNGKKIIDGSKSKYLATAKVCKALKARLKKYTTKELMKVVDGALRDEMHKQNNFFYLTPEYVLRETVIERYLNIPTSSTITQPNGRYIP